MPRWAAIMRLPKPATVLRRLTMTARNLLRGGRGPPPCGASRFEVKERATPESCRIDPVGHVPERPRLVAKLLRETVRVRLRASNVVALDRDDELIEAREIVRDLLVTLDVWPVLREEVASRGDEAEVTERVGERRKREDDAQQYADDGPRGGEPDEGAEPSPALAAHRAATARDGGCHSASRAASASSIERRRRCR